MGHRSVYDAISIGDNCVFRPNMIVSDNVMIDLEAESAYVEDGAIYIPVKIWESMQRGTVKIVPLID